MVKIGVIGYGYVGEMLSNKLSEFYNVICYEQDARKINSSDKNKNLFLTNIPDYLLECNIFIITVQTPIDDMHNPNLDYIIESTKLIAKYMCQGDIVIYESTVYPGVTETICGNLIRQITGFELNKDFYLGYSPERISPGDENHHISNVAKIVSASDDLALDKIKEIYSVVTPKVVVANSIMEAEAAKLLENLQRDVNIALMNEYLLVMKKLGINIQNVIKSANTKWNFNYYLPGFVGGHCIGIDTHYFIKVAQDVGVEPRIANATRIVNEEAIYNIANIVINHVKNLSNKRICIAGITYKENIDDLRNSASLKILRELEIQGCEVLVFDPLANKDVVKDEKIKLCSFDDIIDISVLVCLVYHDIFNEYVFDTKIFDKISKPIVIDPYNKLSNLSEYNEYKL